MKNILVIILFIFIASNASAQTTYNFTGNGKWSTPSNWSNNTVPPSVLPSGSTIIISPSPGDSCVLNLVHRNLPGSNFIITNGARFIVPGGIGYYNDSINAITKLKKVFYPRDTVATLCLECPVNIAQQSEYYIYDSMNRLKTKKTISTIFSNNPIIIDTIGEINYNYFGNSNTIVSYTSTNGNTQLLYYDTLNKLIKDSAQNPLNVTGKIVRTYRYNADTIFQIQSVVNTNGLETLIDTMIMQGNNITFERSRYSNQSFIVRDFRQFTFSPYRNPYSYVNNFSILGSEYRKTTFLFSYNWENSERVTYNQVFSANLNQYNNPNPNAIFTIGIDNYGRVVSSSNTYTGNKATTFEYY